MMLKSSWKALIVNEVDKDGLDEVLSHCPYHDKIITWKALRDTFDEDQGLTDFQAFHERKDLIMWQKATAIFEMKNRETSGMFMTGLGRITAATWDEWHNFGKLMHSKQWKEEIHRLRQTPAKDMFTNGWMAYSNLKEMQRQGQYEAAGIAFVRNLFPEKYEPMESEVKWDPMPGSKADELEGLITGMIKSFTGEENRDEIALCISDYDSVKESLTSAVDSLYARYNDDVMDSVNGVVSVFQGMDQNIANCPDKTKRQVAEVQAKIDRHAPFDKTKIIGALADNKKHVELKLSEMKMFKIGQEYENLGESFGDVFLTLATN
jgi:hypothetical protein